MWYVLCTWHFILPYTGEKDACPSISFHSSPFFAMLLNPNTDWKMPWGARQMRFVLHKAWSLILGCAGGWLHPMLCDWCLSGRVPRGCFSKVEDIAPFPPSPLGQMTGSHCWHGKQTWSGMVWSVPPGHLPWGGLTAQLPHPLLCFLFIQDLMWCHIKELVTAACP